MLLVSRAGLRRGEAVGLRRSDVHMLPDNRVLGCGAEGLHLHVSRRENVNGAWAKSRHARAVPLDRMLIAQAKVEQMTVVTPDKRFGAYGVPVIPA